MKEFWILMLLSLFTTNSLDKAESVQLEETPLKIIDEIFGEDWWDNEKDEEWNKLTLEHNFLHQIDQQNTQLGQIEPNSIDQLGQIESNSTDQNPPLTESDHSKQIEPKSTDQNPPLTESDHSVKAKNGEEQKKIIEKITSNEKRKIINKFHAIKDEFKQKGQIPWKEKTQIENKIAKNLKVNRAKIYEWKKELVLSQKKTKNERKILLEKFDQKKAELTRAGKNSYKEINENVAKEMGLNFTTIYRWKRKFGQTKPKHMYSDSEQKELMKLYYEIKNKNPKIRNEDIAKMLKIGTTTLNRWKKKQFKRQQFHPNSVDGNSV